MNKKDLEIKVKDLVESYNFELVELNIKGKSPAIFEIIIYKKDGVSLDDCTLISRAVDNEKDLDEFFPNDYNIEVASPGLDRKLKTQDDYRRNLENTVEVRLYQKLDNKKEFVGKLIDYNQEEVVLELDDGEKLNLPIENISLMRQYIDFGGK